MDDDTRLDEFRRTITPDLYSPDDIVDWGQIDGQLAAMVAELDALEGMVQDGDLDVVQLTNVLGTTPTVLNAVRLLLSLPDEMGFRDGRELPAMAPADAKARRQLAQLMLDFGIGKVLTRDSSVRDLVRVALVAKGSRRRRFRVTGRFERSVRSLLEKLENQLEIRDLTIGRPRGDEIPGHGSVDFVLRAAEKPFAAIAMFFQARSGGRQQRDLSLTYPSLQQQLDNVPVGLILIADGRGVRDTPKRLLRGLFQSVAAFMTLTQARSGLLLDAIHTLAQADGRRAGLDIPLHTIIRRSLDKQGTVSVKSLPGPEDGARIALARFVSDNPDLALDLSSDGRELQWARSEARSAMSVQEGTARAGSLNVDALVRLIGGSSAQLSEHNYRLEDGASLEMFHWGIVSLPPDPILPSSVLIVALPRDPDTPTLRYISRFALRATPEARVALVVAPTVENKPRRQLQSAFATNVIVLSYADIRRLSQSANSPRDSIIDLLLEQVDLSKVSPFVLRSVTGESMFYGREEEQATILNTVATNSVALIGGRRIGKTSLMKRVVQRLRDADFATFFADCQVVLKWEDLAHLMEREWGVETERPFRPESLFAVLEQLTDGKRRVVVLLDEIDQLLAWDLSHGRDQVPEAFFKACRAASQEGLAQFVFSGERTIARRTSDPHSPHWNFARPLPLKQLDQRAAAELLVQPLRALRVDLTDSHGITSSMWEATSGHPHLVQYLGNDLINNLNQRDVTLGAVLTPDDVRGAVNTISYAEHYLETYWGQASTLERIVSILVASGSESRTDIGKALRQMSITCEDAEVSEAIRFLELYGIIDRTGSSYTLRTPWFNNATDLFGGADAVLDRLKTKIK